MATVLLVQVRRDFFGDNGKFAVFKFKQWMIGCRPVGVCVVLLSGRVCVCVVI